MDTWYVCNRAQVSRGEPTCQSIAGWPIDEAIGELIAAEMTPATVDLALEIGNEVEAHHDEADRLRRRAVERAQIDADLAQRRFMLVDPNMRLAFIREDRVQISDGLGGDPSQELERLRIEQSVLAWKVCEHRPDRRGGAHRLNATFP